MISADGEKVGGISRVIVDPDSDKVTHFLISEGLLFKEKKMIPVHWVADMAEDEMHLAVEKALMERLPEYKE